MNDEVAGRPIDHGLARWVRKRSGDEMLARAAFAASVAEGLGHACARLGDADTALDAAAIAHLRAQPWVGDGSAFTPFVLADNGDFYTWRNWRHETRLADMIRARLEAGARPGIDAAALGADLDRLFPDARANEQRAAAAAALGARLLVLTGGPGTGKTTTVLCLLALLLLHARECGLPAAPSIALAAPTGKAAQRLAVTIADGKRALQQALGAEALALLERIPGRASTLHRLLGVRGDGTFTHGERLALPDDIVVVDEASMIDLAMMRRLFDALRPDTLLVLVGDPDQLWSIDAGSVLADIVAAAPAVDAAQRAGRSGGVATLSKVWRSEAALQVSIDALRTNDDAWRERIVHARADGPLALHDWTTPARLRDLVAAWMTRHREAFAALFAAAPEPRTALGLLRRMQLLCALAGSDGGAAAVNELVTRRLAADYGFDPAAAWYAGRPVIVTRNDYARGLFNGDIGIALAGPDGLRVWFDTHARDGSPLLRDHSPRALPAHETAWAMTIHRSQGSEYDDVAVLLPPDAGHRILSRQLLYTAVSRARRSVELWSGDEALRAAMNRAIERHGGLRRRLRAAFSRDDAGPAAAPPQLSFDFSAR